MTLYIEASLNIFLPFVTIMFINDAVWVPPLVVWYVLFDSFNVKDTHNMGVQNMITLK